MNESTPSTLPSDLSDQILRLAPVNVLLFDADLVCRYAAPVGDRVLGRHRDEVIGRPATEVFPPAGNGLRPMLERAARGQGGWREDRYRFKQPTANGQESCSWSICVDPVASRDFHGVLVSWTDVSECERDVSRRRADAIVHEQRERNAALLAILSDIRNAVTPIAGYLQVLIRRPEMFHGRPQDDVLRDLVLPRIDDIVAAADRLRQPPLYQEIGCDDTRSAPR